MVGKYCQLLMIDAFIFVFLADLSMYYLLEQGFHLPLSVEECCAIVTKWRY